MSEVSELSQLTRGQRSIRKCTREEVTVPRVEQRQEEEVAPPRSTHSYESLDWPKSVLLWLFSVNFSPFT